MTLKRKRHKTVKRTMNDTERLSMLAMMLTGDTYLGGMSVECRARAIADMRGRGGDAEPTKADYLAAIRIGIDKACEPNND